MPEIKKEDVKNVLGVLKDSLRAAAFLTWAPTEKKLSDQWAQRPNSKPEKIKVVEITTSWDTCDYGALDFYQIDLYCKANKAISTEPLTIAYILSQRVQELYLSKGGKIPSKIYKEFVKLAGVAWEDKLTFTTKVQPSVEEVEWAKGFASSMGVVFDETGIYQIVVRKPAILEARIIVRDAASMQDAIKKAAKARTWKPVVQDTAPEITTLVCNKIGDNEDDLDNWMDQQDEYNYEQS